MPWRVVSQPNGKLAIFSTVVDDFTHCNMTENQAVRMCANEFAMGDLEAKDKVLRGLIDTSRFANEIDTIRECHGDTLADKRISEMSL